MAAISRPLGSRACLRDAGAVRLRLQVISAGQLREWGAPAQPGRAPFPGQRSNAYGWRRDRAGEAQAPILRPLAQPPQSGIDVCSKAMPLHSISPRELTPPLPLRIPLVASTNRLHAVENHSVEHRECRPLRVARDHRSSGAGTRRALREQRGETGQGRR